MSIVRSNQIQLITCFLQLQAFSALVIACWVCG